MNIKLRFPESEINQVASRYKVLGEEEELLSRREEVLEQKFLDKELLRLVANWKSVRSAGRVEDNDKNYVREITTYAFSAKNERARIELLTVLDGVGWPTASVILHLFHPDNYPILDFRALWSARLEVPKQYAFPFWWRYVNFCRELSARNSVDMRALDRAMWQYSKENQKNSEVS